MTSLKRARALTRSIFASPTKHPPDGVTGSWTALGAVDGLKPGELKAFPTPEGPVAIADVGGTFYAFDDTCTHRRCSLAEGELDGTVVTCICHGSQFDVTTGAVRRGPAEVSVQTYPVRHEGGELRVRR
jgi:nitrite reductase/ring-hydroxylating ferredoxin subunit